MKTPGFFNLVLKTIKGRFIYSIEIKKIIANSIWLFADSIFRIILGLVVGIWLARYLGPSSFGEFNYALACVGFFTVIASLGIDSNVVRDIVRESEKKNEILGTVFLIKLLGGMIAVLLCVFTVSFLRADHPQVIVLVAVMSVSLLFVSVETISLWFQSQIQSKYTICAKNLTYILGSSIKVILIINEAPLIAFAWAWLVETSIAAVVLFLVYRWKQENQPKLWTASWHRAKKILSAGWPLLIAAIGSMLYMRLDIIMLGEMKGDHSVGIYFAATRLSEAWYFLPMAIASSVQPSLVKARELSIEHFNRRLFQIYRLMAVLSITVSFLVLFLAQPMIDFLYGAPFREAGPVLVLHVWGSIAVFLGVVSTQFLIIENLQLVSLYRIAIGLLCNLILNYILIPIHGAIGAAVATAISYWIATFSIVFFASSRAQVYLMVRALMPQEWIRVLVRR